MDPKVGQMSAATVDKKAAELRRRAEALRANLRRRKPVSRPVLSDEPAACRAADDEARDDQTRG